MNINIPSENVLISRDKQIKAIQDLYWKVKELSEGSDNGAVEELQQKLSNANSEIYTLKQAIGNLGGSVTYTFPDTTTNKSFTSLLGNNGTVKLSEDVTTGRYGAGVIASNKTTLNLNGHDLTCTNAGNYGVVMARGTQEITITGKGTIDAGTGICIECNSANAIINLKGTTTTYQTDRPNAELIYCYAGTINISGGTFKNKGSKFLLNCYDANYRNSTAKIIVTGGKFYDFDPANNAAEGENTSYIPEGYVSVASTVIEDDGEHTVYTVKKA